MYYGKAVSCLLVLIVIAFFVSCGGRQTTTTNGTSISGAIAELDAMVTPKGADPAVFNQLKDALRTALLSRGDGKLVATPPTGTANAIPDLVITDNGDGTYHYAWHYYNVGDYNQDGTVGVADITPLAMHFNQTWDKLVPAEINTLQAVADGSSNEKVDISDVTPIAMNFGVQVSAYRLEKCATENGTYTEVQIIPLSAGLDKDIARMRFSIDITPEAGMWYRLVPVDGEGNGGEASNSMQPPSAVTVWGHSWGNANNDHADAVATDADGNTFIAGSYDVGSFSDAEAIVQKYSPDGTLLWAKTWGGDGDDFAYGITADSDGNAYVTGQTFSFDTVYLVFILKYAPDGSLLWQKTWGGDRYGNGVAIALDNTGLLYVTGSMQHSGGKDALLLLKYDTDGNYIDMRALSASENLTGLALTTNSAGDIYIAGRTKAPAQVADVLVVKYSFDGILQWQKHWGGDSSDEAYGICVDASGDVYVSGRSFSSGFGQGGYDIVLMKLNPSGSVIWQETWGGATHDEAFGMTIDNDANLYLTGGTYGLGSGRYKGLVLKFDSGGTALWAKTWNNADFIETLKAIALYPDGKLALAGWDPTVSGFWGDASGGITEAQTITLADTAYAEVTPAGADSTQAGTEGSPTGVQDTGGGGDDILLLQVDPASW